MLTWCYLAEAALNEAASTYPNFLTVLLNIVANQEMHAPVRHAAVLFVKNFVRQNWKVSQS